MRERRFKKHNGRKNRKHRKHNMKSMSYMSSNMFNSANKANQTGLPLDMDMGMGGLFSMMGDSFQKMQE